MTRNEALPPRKRVKTDPVEVINQGPVPEGFCSVPVESIGTYQDLQAAFLTRGIAPLCLLYGPHRFGKTTVVLRLRELLGAHPSVLVVYLSLNPVVVETEEDFWLALCRTIREEMASFEEFQDMVRRCGKRLWLAIDEMDTMLGNEELTSDFMGWQINQNVLGFLGIGSDALLSMHMKLKETSSSPFELFQIQPFTTYQTVNFFKQIEVCYRFRDSTRQAIMEYSDGAPGVLGTLIRFSIDHGKYDQEWPEWENWFKIQNFSEYLIRCVYAK